MTVAVKGLPFFLMTFSLLNTEAHAIVINSQTPALAEAKGQDEIAASQQVLKQEEDDAIAAARKKADEAVAAEQAKAKQKAIVEAQKKYWSTLSCPSKLIDSQLGGYVGVYEGARLLQRFIDAKDSNESEFAAIRTDCEEIRAKLVESKMKPRQLTETDERLVFQKIAKLNDKETITGIVKYALREGTAQCTYTSVTAKAGLFLGFTLGGMRIVCESPLGLRYSYAGPTGGVGFGVAGSVGFQTGKYWAPKLSLWQAKSTGKTLWQESQIIFNRTQQGSNIDGDGLDVGLTVLFSVERVKAIRLGEIEQNLSYYFDALKLGQTKEARHEITK